MALCFYVPEEEKELMDKPMDAERLLRGLSVTGKLAGFQYAIYMIEKVVYDPSHIQLISKRLYPETAQHFGVSAVSVERAVRTLILKCWERTDHHYLEYIAGTSLARAPTNSEFIDMLASHLRNIQCIQPDEDEA